MDFDKITIDAVSCNVKDSTARKQITELNNRISTIVAGGQQTEGNTELIDIRTGADGKVYPTAGDAVRGQISELKEDLDTLNQGGLNLKEDFIGRQVNEWLDEHPEATTTVQDGAITEPKIHADFLPYIKMNMLHQRCLALLVMA